MRKLLLSSLVLAMAAPAWAYTITPGLVQSIPTTYNTRLGRPAVSNYRVLASGLLSGGGQAQLFTLKSNTVTPIGLNSAGNLSVSPAGFTQDEKIGIAGNWIAADGGPDGGSIANPAWVMNGVSTYREGDNVAPDQNYIDVDANGKVIYARWSGPVVGVEVMYDDLSDGIVNPAIIMSNATPVYGGAIGTSLCANLADDGSGKFTWSGNGGANNTHYIFDLNTSTNYLVYTGPAGTNVIRSRISDDGNWIVWNERNAGESQKKADIMLQNVANPLLPGVAINLTNNKDRVREDPNIEIVDANTAIVVWGESAVGEGQYYIMAAVVENLMTTPVVTQLVTVASEVGAQLRFPDVDENMITWARNVESPGAMTQYALIPEPASLGLLSLAGLALLRRR